MDRGYEKEHLQRLRTLLPECTVLLRSNGDFPLAQPCGVALYGSGARRTVKGGAGSGEVNSRTFVNVEQGLAEAGFTITTKTWLDGYENVYAAAKKQFLKDLKEKAKREHKSVMMIGMGATIPEPEYVLPLDGAGDVAVYVLARNSGEGSDRQAMPGDVLLTGTERRDILALREKYAKFMLVLNVGGPVDLSPVLDVENILILSQLGVDTGAVLGDLLLGKAYPSGKLATTWAAWETYPRIGSFGGNDDTLYKEGVYVGYRYFDSIGQKAMFPFGYGLGYTVFSVADPRVRVEGAEVTVCATVTNTGAHTGKEVVQLYVSVPAGRLDQPYQALASFIKTGELAPGGSQQVELCFTLTDLAGYDTRNAAYILEAGSYILRLGTSSVNTTVCGVVQLDSDVTVRKVRHIGGTPDFSDWKPEQPREQTAPEWVPALTVSAADITASHAEYGKSPRIDPAVKKLPDNKLAYLNVGAFSTKGGVLSIIGSAGRNVAGAAGETTGELKEDGLPPLVMADGPAGLRLSRDYYVDKKGVHSMDSAFPESITEVAPAPLRFLMGLMTPRPKRGAELLHQYATAIPIGTAVAQSWNLDLAEQCGDIVGDEMERFGVHLWLAPALNIHRSILCGRNFEYFSEDPLLSGLLASAITKGVQRHPGRGVTVKHFAANNQETNRYNSNSQVSERALREIYLRGFAICVRQAQPHAVMTSYNLLNGQHTSECRDLIEDFLRGECGFEGIVMTDWLVALFMSSKDAKYPAPTATGIAAAGGDMVMPGGKDDYNNILEGLRSGRLSREQLQANATRIVRMVRKLNQPGSDSQLPQ